MRLENGSQKVWPPIVESFCGVKSTDEAKLKEYQVVLDKYISDNVLDFHFTVRATNDNYSVVEIETKVIDGPAPLGAHVYLKKVGGQWMELLTSGLSEPATCKNLQAKGFPTDLDTCYSTP